MSSKCQSKFRIVTMGSDLSEALQFRVLEDIERAYFVLCRYLKFTIENIWLHIGYQNEQMALTNSQIVHDYTISLQFECLEDVYRFKLR
jgi:hypothetical protein